MTWNTTPDAQNPAPQPVLTAAGPMMVADLPSAMIAQPQRTAPLAQDIPQPVKHAGEGTSIVTTQKYRVENKYRIAVQEKKTYAFA